MTTEYVFSASLVFWGDTLEVKRLADRLQLSVSDSRTKGVPFKRPDGTESASLPKTGMLCFDLSKPESTLRRDPESQLQVATEALKRLSEPLAGYGVVEAELQTYVYYNLKASGEPDFFFSPELLGLLLQHRIALRVTVLP
jgi:hypothetical protein